MARLWSCGFELNSITSDVEFGVITSTGLSIVTSPVRSGTYALQATGSGGPFARFVLTSATDSNGPYFARFYLYISSATNGSCEIVSFRTTAAIRLTSSNTLQLWNHNSLTQIGSDSSVLSTSTWYLVELKIDKTGGAGASIAEAKLNGTSFATTSTATFGTGLTAFNFGFNLNAEGKTGTILFDDMAINDSTGANQTSYPGSGQIMHLRPNAAGDNTQLARGGTSVQATNWQGVSEVTPDDGITFNNEHVTGKVDDHNIDDTPAGIGSSDTINVVQVGIRFSGGAASSNSSLQARVKKAASGTVSSSSAITPTSTTWLTNALAAPNNYPLTLYKDPDGTNAWTKTTLDSAQIGYIISTGTANDAKISDVWLLVDWTPAVVGGVTVLPPSMAMMGVGA